jgi:hypothetical protein
MNLRVLQSQWEPFARALCARRDVETAGIVLAERLQNGSILLARRLHLVPDDGYQVRHSDQLRVNPLVINRLVREARDRKLSVLTIHTHPGAQRPWFSKADDAGDARLIPSLFAQMAGPHGSLVLAGQTGIPVGRAWTAPGIRQPIGVRIVGSALQVVPAAAHNHRDEAWFDRQRLALGENGQGMLRDVHVAVVGLGGTGSVVLAQLAHLGVGRITVIDGDRVEASNVSRVLGATRHDAGATWKVDVAARYVEGLGLGTEIRVIRGHLGTEVSPVAVEGCDVVLSCVDTHTPRALLNRLAYERAIPVIDLGSAFRVDSAGRVVGAAGRVVVLGPGRPCLGCWGHLDATRLRLEALPATDRAHLAAEGYIDGAEVAQPSVVAFNTSVAGAAVVELLRLVTGFAGGDDPPQRLSLDFMTGNVRRNRLIASPECGICSPTGRAWEEIEAKVSARSLSCSVTAG